MFLFKVTALEFHTLCPLFLPCLEHEWQTTFFKLFAARHVAFMISCFDLNLRPRSAFITSGNNQKSKVARLELYCECGMIWTLFVVKKSATTTTTCGRALSWCRRISSTFFSGRLFENVGSFSSTCFGCCGCVACRYHISIFEIVVIKKINHFFAHATNILCFFVAVTSRFPIANSVALTPYRNGTSRTRPQ